MDQWVQLEPAKLLEAEQGTMRGAKVTMYTSPYDIPRAYRMGKEGERIVIEFRYLDEEATRPRTETDAVVLDVGRHSGRIHKIEVDTKSLDAAAIQLRIAVAAAVRQAVDHYIQGSEPKRTKAFEVTRRALDQVRGEITRGLCSA